MSEAAAFAGFYAEEVGADRKTARAGDLLAWRSVEGHALAVAVFESASADHFMHGVTETWCSVLALRNCAVFTPCRVIGASLMWTLSL